MRERERERGTKREKERERERNRERWGGGRPGVHGVGVEREERGEREREERQTSEREARERQSPLALRRCRVAVRVCVQQGSHDSCSGMVKWGRERSRDTEKQFCYGWSSGHRTPHQPMTSECGTSKTVKVRFWSWLSGKNYENI